MYFLTPYKQGSCILFPSVISVSPLEKERVRSRRTDRTQADEVRVSALAGSGGLGCDAAQARGWVELQCPWVAPGPPGVCSGFDQVLPRRPAWSLAGLVWSRLGRPRGAREGLAWTGGRKAGNTPQSLNTGHTNKQPRGQSVGRSVLLLSLVRPSLHCSVFYVLHVGFWFCSLFCLFRFLLSSYL